MAWICVELDGTLLQEVDPMEMGMMDPSMGGDPNMPMDPSMQDPAMQDPNMQDPMAQGPAVMPTDGSIEAMNQLAMEGHRLTVFTSKFAPMPDDRKQMLKEEIETELVNLGFPPMEVWTGTTKPDADIFIGNKDVTYDGDWGLVLAQTQVMLEDQGLVPGLDTYGEPDVMGEDPSMGGEEMPMEEQPMPEEAAPAPKAEKKDKPKAKDKPKDKKEKK